MCRFSFFSLYLSSLCVKNVNSLSVTLVILVDCAIMGLKRILVNQKMDCQDSFLAHSISLFCSYITFTPQISGYQEHCKEKLRLLEK